DGREGQAIERRNARTSRYGHRDRRRRRRAGRQGSPGSGSYFGSDSVTSQEEERLRRWRLVLGKPAESDPAGGGSDGLGFQLGGDDLQMDRVLEALYDSERSAGLGPSCPNVNRWLGDIR